MKEMGREECGVRTCFPGSKRRLSKERGSLIEIIFYHMQKNFEIYDNLIFSLNKRT